LDYSFLRREDVDDCGLGCLLWERQRMIKVSAAATVMISREEYHHLTRGDRRVMGLEDFTDEDVAALEEIRAPQAARAFDSELKSS
jgi:hypothetical protein